MDELPDEVRERLERFLQPGERVAWCSRPVQTPGYRGPISCFVVLGFLLMGAALVAGSLVAKTTAAEYLVLLIVLIGAGAGCVYWARHNLRVAASLTCYCVTDQRAVILDSGYCGNNGPSPLQSLSLSPYRTRRWSLLPAEIDHLRCEQASDGSGNLILHVAPYKDDDGVLSTALIGFYRVPQVCEAEAAVRTLLARQGE